MPRKIRQIRIEGNVAFVPLTQNCEAIIDAADVHLVEGYNWYAAKPGRSAYAVRGVWIGGAKIFMHRVILDAPDGVFVDHINGNGLDNRRANLRLATPAQNVQNSGRQSNNTSGVRGVSFHKRSRKWQAAICCNRKRTFLGQFDTLQEASQSYATARAALHGEFGRTE